MILIDLNQFITDQRITSQQLFKIGNNFNNTKKMVIAIKSVV